MAIAITVPRGRFLGRPCSSSAQQPPPAAGGRHLLLSRRACAFGTAAAARRGRGGIWLGRAHQYEVEVASGCRGGGTSTSVRLGKSSRAATCGVAMPWLDLFPIAGAFFANALFLAPAPAVYRAAAIGKLGSLNTLPLALMAVNSTAWFIYAIVIRDRYLALGNGPGCIASLWYVTTTLPLIPPESTVQRKWVQTVLLFGAASLLALCATFGLAEYTHEAQKLAFGLFGSLACTLLFASPLSTAYQVVTKRDASTIYAPLTIAQVVNCALWAAYGFIIHNPWVIVPNGIGTILGLIQLVLKMIYNSRLPPPEIRTLPPVLEVIPKRDRATPQHAMELLSSDNFRNSDDMARLISPALKQQRKAEVVLTDAVALAVVEEAGKNASVNEAPAAGLLSTVKTEEAFPPSPRSTLPEPPRLDLDEAARVLAEAAELEDRRTTEPPLDLSGLQRVAPKDP